MKRFCVFLAVILLAVSLFGCRQESVSLETGESVFGSFTTTDFAGNPFNEEVFRAKKLTMVNLWATFCDPCIREMPDLAALQKEYEGQLQIVGVAVDLTDRNGNVLPEQIKAAESIIKSTGADYVQLLPSPSLNKAYLNQVQAVPETVFLDENGCQIGQSYLGSRSKSEWKSIIEKILEGMQ